MTRKAPRFELHSRAKPSRAARDVALAQLDHALRSLATDDPEAIHEARKVCKKLRALLRLIRPFLGRSYRTENTRLRDVGRALSKGREAAVLVETADALLIGDDRLEALAERIRARPQPKASVSRRQAIALLEMERQRALEWPIRELSTGNLLVGLLASYRRAREAWHDAHRHVNALALHEWRKQAKYHGYQCALVNPVWPDREQRVKGLKKLSDWLGEHHDLHVLALVLRRDGRRLASRDSLHLARKRIHTRQRELADKALTLGRILFGVPPLQWLEQQPRT